MLWITLQYIPIKLDAAFLNIKQNVVHLKHYQWAFFVHVFSSIWVLILGVPQFINSFRVLYPKIHQFLGKAYIAITLILASPSGLVMGYYGNGGWIAQLAFVLLALFWFYFTWKGFQYAKLKEWNKHQKFMTRSYALTLSAITLRLVKFGLVHLFAWGPMDIYRIAAWTWVLNLVMVELWWYFEKKNSSNRLFQ